MTQFRTHRFWSLWGSALLLAGCGGETTVPPAQAIGTSVEAAEIPANAPSPAAGSSVIQQTSLTTIANDDPRAPTAVPAAKQVEDLPPLPFAKEGTDDWRLFRITELLAPPAAKKRIVAADGSQQEVDRAPQEIAAERKASLQEVVKHAGQVIASTHADPARETAFVNAVHYLCLADVELALMGESESAKHLGEVAEAIFHEKPESEAAVESGYRLVELARRMAEQFGRKDPEWVRAEARQARLFAERFPKEQSRVAIALMDAGRACELAGFRADARDCIRLVHERFPNSTWTEETLTDLRRLTLEGKRLTAGEFGGPTIDGGFLTIDHLQGKHALVVFWMTDSPTFKNDLPVLRQLEEQHRGTLQIVGVNLDEDEAAVDKFLDEQQIGWRQIFDSNPDYRGAYNVVAEFYGIHAVPVYWLVGPDGTVLSAPADVRKIAIP